MTSKVIRWVLVDGVTGAGATVDGGALDIADLAAFDAEALFQTLLDGADLRTIGLTWSRGAEAAAVKVRRALAAMGGGAQLVAVTDAEAAKALAGGIAEVAGYNFLVVCTVEPDATVVATVSSRRVTAQRISCGDELSDRAGAVVNAMRPCPDAVFVLGSADPDALASALVEVTARPVITAAEAQFALARGAGLAAAGAVLAPVRPIQVSAPPADAPVGKPRRSLAGVAASVLAAAVVAFVVSLTLALVPRMESDEQPHHDTVAEQTIRPAVAPAPRAPASVAPEVATPPAEPAEVPPAPADVPQATAPATPAEVPAATAPVQEPPVAQQVEGPPAAPAQPPRLRDRIIEKIPLINRLH